MRIPSQQVNRAMQSKEESVRFLALDLHPDIIYYGERKGKCCIWLNPGKSSEKERADKTT